MRAPERVFSCVVLFSSVFLSTSSQWVSPDHPWTGSRPGSDLVLNQWASWGVWSVCSRTCGGGASVRTRTCITRDPVGGPCSGEARQYKICNTKVCPVGSEDFRELQCRAFNHRPLSGSTSFTWIPFNSGLNPCELLCLAVGHMFYFNFGRVLDGTSCGTDPGSFCVNGRCLKPGCDQVFGSGLTLDVCMICGGFNQSCLQYRNKYSSIGTDSVFGYKEVAMIPAGATHIRVTDNSRNYLVLQTGRSQFIINGHWTISGPGEYSVAGTKLLYKRSADVWERIELNGPTQEDLLLMVLSTESSADIEYEYYLPPEKYFLFHGPKSPHSQSHATASVTVATTRSISALSNKSIHQRPIRPPRVKPPRQTSSLRPHTDHRENLLPLEPQRSCGTCVRVRGRRQRQKQFCSKDYVIRAQILSRVFLGSETRYSVRIVESYQNRFPLLHREFIWAPDRCECPLLVQGRQYVLMLRRHINHEKTLDRILLERTSYSALYGPREDQHMRGLQRTCERD